MKGLQKTAKHYWHLHNKEKYRSIPHAISEKQGFVVPNPWEAEVFVSNIYKIQNIYIFFPEHKHKYIIKSS